MGRNRRRFSAEEKVRILKRHLVDKEAVSDICEKEGIQPTLFYQWQRQFFENGTAAFERKPAKKKDRAEQKILTLEAKVREKNDVIAEILADHVKLKKELGDL
jgi:transposase-like protein